VRVVCECSTCREIEPEALARLVGWSVALKGARTAFALFAVREEGRGGRGSGESQATGHPDESELVKEVCPPRGRYFIHGL
jgi:hypothetical protein